MTRSRKRGCFAIVFGAMFVALSWLNFSFSSHVPLDPVTSLPTFPWSIVAELGRLLDQAALPAVLVGLAITGNVHHPSVPATYAVLFLQWLVVGYVIAIGLFRERAAADRADTVRG